MWKGNDMKYKLKQFRIIENKSTWWTEKGMPGKADCKIISINLFYNGRENIPSVIKEVVTNQANGIKSKVAEILGTNRTYLSRIINEQSKLSFTHYVNRFRIEEAIRLLSDPNNETPLKAISTELGFNSISTFYNLFQSSVGMTPSQYRNKVMELQKEQ